jgi:RNA polymerase sigma-70 factor (ECF subfamily)
MAQPTPTVDAPWIRSVVAQYERPLTLYATKIVGDLERARDVVQEAFLKLCRQERAKVEPYLAEWLYTVCRNRALDVCRKESRLVRLGDAQVAAQIDRESDPSASIEGTETRSLVLAMIGSLPDKQQESIRLKFQHGLSYRQISKVMDLTTSYVGYLIHAGLKTIRDRLSEETGDDTGPVARIPGPVKQPARRLSEDRSGDPPQNVRGKLSGGRGG